MLKIIATSSLALSPIFVNYLFDILYNGDFVVEQGVSGVWHYEKWNSGKLVLYTRYSQGTIDTTKPYGYAYISDQLSVIVPNMILSVTSAIATLDAIGGIGAICVNNSHYTIANSHIINYFIWHATTRSSWTPIIHWYIVGTWK